VKDILYSNISINEEFAAIHSANIQGKKRKICHICGKYFEYLFV
jgi:hypothetical protein